MARGGGFFSRVFKRIGNFLSDTFERIGEQVEPPREREPPPPPGPGPGGGERNEFRQIWDDFEIPRDHGNFHDHFEFFMDVEIGMEINDLGEQIEDWQLYLRYLVLGESEYKRNDVRNPYWAHMGIDPGDFDWQAWRAAMGDTGKRKR